MTKTTLRRVGSMWSLAWGPACYGTNGDLQVSVHFKTKTRALAHATLHALGPVVVL